MFEEDDSVFAAMRAGARGYALKEAEADEMIRVYASKIARRLRSFFSRPAVPNEVLPELTPREAGLGKGSS